MVMDAVRKLTEKWKQCPLLLLISFCVIGIAVGLCAATVSRKKRIRDEGGLAGEEDGSDWGVIKKELMGSMCWSGRSSWSEREGVDLQKMQKMPALLAGCREVEWTGMSSPVSPLWQRRVLMGERCELPRFSGLILYDERGHPLRHSNKTSNHQEKPTTAVTTTLRDLL